MRLKLGWKRAPVTPSIRSISRSRSRMAYMSGVGAPNSEGNEHMKTRWLEMRNSSDRITRMYCARGGASIPMRRSAATMNGTSLANPEIQSMRLTSAVIWP
jgi:hypothetical protein